MERIIPPDLPLHYEVRFLDDVDSTNAEAARLLHGCADAENPSLAPTWIVARSQTAGRGRRGRVWTSPPGNLYASLLLRSGVGIGIAPQLSLVAALATRDMLLSFFKDRHDDITVKWPNDVLAGGSKLAGILLETHLAVDKGAANKLLRKRDAGWTAIGIGVNLRHFPADATYPATSIEHWIGLRVEPRDALNALARSMDSRLALWNRGEGFGRLRGEWMECAYGVGAEVCAGLGIANGEVRGVFLGLDENGALRLRLNEGGECVLNAADVRFLRTSSMATEEVNHA